LLHRHLRLPLTAVLLSCAAFGLVCTTAAARASFDAEVIGVTDGDTLTVLGAADKSMRRVRIVGIDAPEKGQPFGAPAREQLAQLAFGKVASLECRTSDRNGRNVCLVRVEGMDVGLRMVELGFAWHFKRYAATQRLDEARAYGAAEVAARASRQGLWRDLGTIVEPTPPWAWRKGASQYPLP
jgi:endonuclease YncB( thermonuclease family)